MTSKKHEVRVTRTTKQQSPEHVRRLGHALIELARAQLEAEAQAQAEAEAAVDNKTEESPDDTVIERGDAA